MVSGPTESSQPLAEEKDIPDMMEESSSGDRDEEYYSMSAEHQQMQRRIERVRRLAKAELLFAVAAITLSGFVLSCKPCGTEQTAGSGIWCSVYFVLIAVMCIGNHDMIPAKIMRIFGFVGIHFALLMLGVEALEATAALGDTPLNYVGAAAHLVLCGIASVQLILIIGTVCLHSGRWRRTQGTQGSGKMSSKDECILTRILAKR